MQNRVQFSKQKQIKYDFEKCPQETQMILLTDDPQALTTPDYSQSFVTTKQDKSASLSKCTEKES